MNHADTQKALLDSVIEDAISRRDLLTNSKSDFIRDRKLSLKTMLNDIGYLVSAG